MAKEVKESQEFKERKELQKQELSNFKEKHRLRMEELAYMRETIRFDHDLNLQRIRIKSAEIKRTQEAKQWRR